MIDHPTGPVRPRRLDHLGLEVRDLAASERFYIDLFGMEVEMRMDEQVLLRFGDTRLALFHKPNRPVATADRIDDPLARAHHAFEVDYPQLREAQRLFRARGVIHHQLVDWGDHDCLYFLDPDGHLLEFIGYRRETPAPADAVRLVPVGDRGKNR